MFGTDVAGGYHEYFGDSVDQEAMVYLMLVSDFSNLVVQANKLGQSDAARGIPQCDHYR